MITEQVDSLFGTGSLPETVIRVAIHLIIGAPNLEQCFANNAFSNRQKNVTAKQTQPTSGANSDLKSTSVYSPLWMWVL